MQHHYETTIKPEIDELIAEVKAARQNDPEIDAYHKGWRVFFSPVQHRPKVLLIGINPGPGKEGNEDTSFWTGQEEDEQFEYTAFGYRLAKEVSAAFHDAGLSHVLARSTVKTNFFFLSTTKQKDLYKITDRLGRRRGRGPDLLGDKFFRKSYEWTRQLIELVSPAVVVCEGREAYKNVSDLFADFEEKVWENDCGYGRVPSQNLTVIGFSRFYSRIRNKPGLTKLLKQFVKD